MKPDIRPAMRVCAVLPCRNEASSLPTIIGELRSAMPELSVLVVDDASSDGTGEVARELGAEVVRRDRCEGYGAALWTGLAAARAPWVFYTDGDGQVDVSGLPQALKLAQQTSGVVVGRRTHRADGALRKVCGKAWSRMTDWVLRTDVDDVDCPFKIFPKSFLDETDAKSLGALIDAELLFKARQAGYPITEVDVKHRRRQAGHSSGLRPSVVAKALLELIRFAASPHH